MSKSGRGKPSSSSTAENKESFECPTCEKELSTEYGRKSHRVQVHDHEPQKPTVSCDHCGETIEKGRWAIEKYDNLYCGVECSSKGRDTRVEVCCSWCGESKRIKNVHYERSDNFFCNNDCQGKWFSDKYSKVDHPNKNPETYEERECEICGDTFEHQLSVTSPGRFCSRECVDEWKRMLPREEHPRYDPDSQTETIRYGPNWDQQRRKALKRDQYRCQRCREIQPNLDRSLDVHHRRRIKWYENEYDAPEWYEMGNRLENLITFCRSCHRKWEGIPLRPDTR